MTLNIRAFLGPQTKKKKGANQQSPKLQKYDYIAYLPSPNPFFLSSFKLFSNLKYWFKGKQNTNIKKKCQFY